MGVSPIWPGNPFLYPNGNPTLHTDPYGLFGLPSWNDVKDAATSFRYLRGHPGKEVSTGRWRAGQLV